MIMLLLGFSMFYFGCLKFFFRIMLNNSKLCVLLIFLSGFLQTKYGF